MKIFYRIALVFAAALFLVACNSDHVAGDGKIVTKERKVSAFNQIAVSGSYNVAITQGNRESLKVTTDSNIQPLVIATVQNGRLSVRGKPGAKFSPSKSIVIQVVVKQLKHITLSGANRFAVSNFRGDQLQVDTNGSVQGSLSGRVKTLSLLMSGSGKVHAGKLEANVVKIRLSGSGQVMVDVKDKLDVKVSGSGTILYSGSPKSIDQSIMGSGKLIRVKQ